MAFIDCAEKDEVFTPLAEGRGVWPAGAFASDVGEVKGVCARVISLKALREDKSLAREDPAVVAKDAADVAALSRLAADR